MPLRVIGGVAGSRRIPSPPGRAARPTGARVREALFSVWGERVEGARVLDLCAGSGAVSLEALSRGAARAIAVERDPRLCRAIRKSAEALGLAAGLDARRADAVSEVGRIRAASGCGIDLAFADPPWRDAALRARLLEAVFAADPLCPSLVMEAPAGAGAREAAGAGWRLARERRYGGTALLFYEPSARAETGRNENSASPAGGAAQASAIKPVQKQRP